MTEIDIIISDLIEVFVEYIDYKVFTEGLDIMMKRVQNFSASQPASQPASQVVVSLRSFLKSCKRKGINTYYICDG